MRLLGMFPELNPVQICTSARPQEQLFLLRWPMCMQILTSRGAPLVVSDGWEKRYWWNEPINIYKNAAFCWYAEILHGDWPVRLSPVPEATLDS